MKKPKTQALSTTQAMVLVQHHLMAGMLKDMPPSERERLREYLQHQLQPLLDANQHAMTQTELDFQRAVKLTMEQFFPQSQPPN